MAEDNIRRLEKVSVHYIRNKAKDEGFILSESPLTLDEEMTLMLKDFFLKGFKEPLYYRFFDEDAIENNVVYSLAAHLFEHPEFFHEDSKELAGYLHRKTLYPEIADGEFFVAYFEDYVVDGTLTEAIGLFKTENKETFLQVDPDDGEFSLETDRGISLKKIDRACLIYNMEKEEGFRVQVIDNTKGGAESRYWTDDFLQVQQRHDRYFDTEYTMEVYKDYVTQQLPQEYEVSRIDQVDLLNKSINFFKEKENFEMDAFKREVLVEPEVIQSFDQYKNQYEEERGISLSPDFEIDPGAVKKKQRYFRSIIKLDKNFHIYVHGDKSKLEQGEDEKGKFYRLYFDEEN